MNNPSWFSCSAWICAKKTLYVAGWLLITVCPLAAQTPKAKSDSEALLLERMKQDASKAQSKDAKPAGPIALEEAMEKALKQNADILFAEAKVREAEAELNRVQQQVLGKLVVATVELNVAETFLLEVVKRMERLISLRQSGKGIISELELDEAQIGVTKYKGEVTRKQAELDLLIGKLPMGSRQALFGVPGSATNVPILKTYVVPNRDAEAIAKLLKETYRENSALRFTPIGNTQVLVYAPAPIQADIAKYVDTNNKLQQFILAPELPVPVPLQFKNSQSFFGTMRARIKWSSPTTVKDALNFMLEHVTQVAKESGVNLVLTPDVESATMPRINLVEPITFAAALQLIEDMTKVRFIVRDYGIVGVRADDIPPGAVLLDDVVKQMPPETPSEKKAKSK
jgi:hypothetical protein